MSSRLIGVFTIGKSRHQEYLMVVVRDDESVRCSLTNDSSVPLALSNIGLGPGVLPRFRRGSDEAVLEAVSQALANSRYVHTFSLERSPHLKEDAND